MFERQWALTLLEQTLAAVRAEYVADSKEKLFDALKGVLAGEPEMPYRTLATLLDTTEGALKVAAHRLRKRYRLHLRREVAQTVANADDVDDEIRDLFTALAP